MTNIQMTSSITVEPIAVHADDSLVAMAARVSTLGEASIDQVTNRQVDGLIRRLMRDGHGSPFEHGGMFTFRVHAPLYVMTEHLRHRVGWAYNGESGRYKTFEPVFYTPPAERGLTQVGKAIDYDIQPGTDVQRQAVSWDLHVNAQTAWEHYEDLLRAGIAREVARQVLPTNLMTTYYTSCNPRSLMAFLELRTSANGGHPLWEIEQVALQYEAIFADAMPVTYQEFAKEGVAP